MVQSIAAKDVTLRELKQNFGLQMAEEAEFFPEWREGLTTLSEEERRYLERVKANFLELMEDPPMLENSVKLVVLAPLLDLAGFYHKPFRIETETSVDLAMEDEGLVIRGRIDVLVLKHRLWLLVIEAKRAEFSLQVGISQALAYMLASPESDQPLFGLVMNGSNFVFLKLVKDTRPQYAKSKELILDQDDGLAMTLQVMKRLGEIINVTDD